MKLPKSKIEKAAAPARSGRPTLKGIYFDAKRKCFLSSNGFIAARSPIELLPGDEEHESGLVSLENVKAIRKARRNILPSEIEPVKFPSEFIHEELLDTPSEAPIIVLDAMQLYNLAQAICTPNKARQLHVGLYLPKKDKPVIVKSLNEHDYKEDKSVGLLMEIQADASRRLRDALGELREVLVNGDQVESELRARLRHALVGG